jgi:CDP-diacylglycerol---glycerol-3-phosphate 3-phosphatidyltransferase
MNRRLPNLLTIGRLILSVVFFVLLAWVRVGDAASTGLLAAGLVVYGIAAVTDVLDGYLARRWNVTGTFGRLADPIVDKVIVCGAFAMFAGRNFAAASPEALCEFERRLPEWMHGGMVSGVQAWMVVVLLAREFVISGIRGYSESQGISFPATQAGKAKMFVQSAAICTILVQMTWLQEAAWAAALKLTLVWLMVVTTVVSGLLYAKKAQTLLREATRG